ncbi:MAG: hypothetical protein ACJ76Z_02865 [Thermoleophilaceae bacterium]
MRRLINLTITALVAFAAISGVASAQSIDHVSPDARDSAPQVSSPQIDLRSPDARDAATRPVKTYAPGHVTQASPVVSVPTVGFDWADAGIGAAGVLALIALGAGALMIASQRRRGRHFGTATH